MKDSIPKLKEELPILSDEINKKDTSIQNEPNLKTETDKDKNDIDNSTPPVLLPNNYDNKDAGIPTENKEKSGIKIEGNYENESCKQKNETENENVLDSSKPEEPAPLPLEEKLEESKVSETETEVGSVSDEKLTTESNSLNRSEDEKTDIDMSVEKSDTAVETKNEEEIKEDEETDIEPDLRKEEEDQQKGVAALETSGCKQENSQPVPVLENEQENEDRKYDCDTDTETKYDASNILKREESTIIKKEKDESIEGKHETYGKSEKMKSEETFEDIKEKYNIHRILPRDDILHSHIDDSQVSFKECWLYLVNIYLNLFSKSKFTKLNLK